MRQKPSSADEEDVFFIANQKSSSIILLETKTFLKNLEKIRPNVAKKKLNIFEGKILELTT